jgi:hypothetical protein
MFRTIILPIFGSTRLCVTACGIKHPRCCQPPAGNIVGADANRTSMTNTYCVYTVLRYSWWWIVGLSETCRVLHQINLRNSASRWLTLQEYIIMHVPLNVKMAVVLYKNISRCTVHWMSNWLWYCFTCVYIYISGPPYTASLWVTKPTGDRPDY